MFKWNLVLRVLVWIIAYIVVWAIFAAILFFGAKFQCWENANEANCPWVVAGWFGVAYVWGFFIFIPFVGTLFESFLWLFIKSEKNDDIRNIKEKHWNNSNENFDYNQKKSSVMHKWFTFIYLWGFWILIPNMKFILKKIQELFVKIKKDSTWK